MKPRYLDGVYFRVNRNGQYMDVCFSDLLDREMVEILKDKDTEWLKSMCIILGKTIRAIGDEFNLEGE